MTGTLKVKRLRQNVTELLEKALATIRGGRLQAPRAWEGRFRAAEYLLTEAREYVDAAFALLAGHPRASLSVSRWVLEASLNLLWATAKPNEVDNRLRLLAAEALRLDAARSEGLAELYPGDTKRYLAQADEARQEKRALIGQGKRLASLDTRVKSLKEQLDAKGLPSPYAFYRICCDAAHPGLAVWRRFQFGPGGAAIAKSPPDNTQMAVWMVSGASLHLIAGAYCLTNMGDAKVLKAWWDKITKWG